MKNSWSTSGVDLHLELDGAGGRRTGLERALRGAIRDGRLGPRARLPSTRRLAVELGLARGTVQAAYDQLVAEGYLTTRRGSGTTVAVLPERRPEPPGPADAPDPPRHDLVPGSPDATSFPVAAWLRATRRALSRAPVTAYGYGDPRGRTELRTALAEYLGRTRGVLARPERIVIVSGFVQALGLLAQVLNDPGPATVAMESPGLDFHRAVAARRGLTVLPLPVDDRGARTELLATPGFRAVRAAVVTPSHQFPTGVSLHPTRRRALTEWARSRGGLIVEDDYDGEFRYDRQPVGALHGMAPDHVVYLGTASKTLAPGLRLGWMVLPDHLVDPVVEAKLLTDHCTETIGQLALAELISSHAYDRHVRASRLRYRRRRDLLLSRLDRPDLEVRGISAGLHALVRFSAEGPTEADVRRQAEARGLALGYLGEWWHAPGDHPQAVIVGYGTPSERAYPAALDALAETLDAAGRGG
ncbi:GntR family transcriptional regulator [Wenjunlia vitaminophila]|uniref:GntR family transcriptional regulator n=1 Tax=Wenjunlia vitaminophila TaxID=76728 RepID=A0A0T6LKX9_WENVI|nr:PLP-dependent aminotransferase family protein [Wenjunlia vitaminophila]KRV46545.1 GntR family transcriptional regulator [Wenjunlia vitaminophila]